MIDIAWNGFRKMTRQNQYGASLEVAVALSMHMYVGYDTCYRPRCAVGLLFDSSAL